MDGQAGRPTERLTVGGRAERRSVSAGERKGIRAVGRIDGARVGEGEQAANGKTGGAGRRAGMRTEGGWKGMN